ncbi:MAG: histidine phosphatase family protein [Acidimicrobiia bacterium]|jgi:8-oxo-dGTP diphosphatase|nr:histidine phosphatase family protein [Acidimicrobiia bacterium]MBA3982248.1 histidine phosphatase family protein [Acidimicrobiia bacterium]MDQ3392173.1 histidine phosphatase family protein [Actinomycetota bacterium]
MTLYLVRHAKAGSRRNWDGEDTMRPLSKKGWAQAEALADRLISAMPTALRSSPYVRCRQTLEPLAARLGIDVVDEEALREGASFGETFRLLADLPDGAVCCSHGDVIPETIAGLHRRGMRVDAEPLWTKGSVWLLERDGDEFTTADLWPPPPDS